jgi:hypothetical protein
MKPTIKHFTGGLLFLALGLFSRSLYRTARPDGDFVVHPLATDHSGLAVEINGWIGLVSLVLIGVGLILVAYSLQFGIKSGKIQSFIKEKLPKRKAPPQEGDEEDEEDE